MLELSAEEKDAILRLGKDSDIEVIKLELLQALVNKGILYHRPSDGHIDFTELGEATFDQLSKDSADSSE